MTSVFQGTASGPVLNYFLVGGDWASDDAEVERVGEGGVEAREWALVDLKPTPHSSELRLASLK